MDIKNLLELQPSTWFKIAITCLSTFLPWTLHLYLFKEDLFIDLDVFKIILLASTLSIPMWVANFIISCIIFFNKKCPLFNLEIELLFYFGSLLTIFSSYLYSLLSSIFPSYQYIILAIIEVVFVALAIFMRKS